MKTKVDPPNESSASPQPSRSAGSPMPTAMSVSSSPDAAARIACAIYLLQGPSTLLSIKLITERASTATQASRENHDRRYDGYPHWGLND